MRRFWRQILLLIAASGVAAGAYACWSQQVVTQPRPGGAQTTITDTVTPLPPTAMPTNSQPNETVTPEPFETPAFLQEIQLSSARVELGKPYPFLLYTHCGVDFSVDFDGSYWDLAPDADIAFRDSNLPPEIGNPEQEGTMTLVEPERARFDYEGGSIPFVRHKGPKVVSGCD